MASTVSQTSTSSSRRRRQFLGGRVTGTDGVGRRISVIRSSWTCFGRGDRRGGLGGTQQLLNARVHALLASCSRGRSSATMGSGISARAGIPGSRRAAARFPARCNRTRAAPGETPRTTAISSRQVLPEASRRISASPAAPSCHRDPAVGRGGGSLVPQTGFGPPREDQCRARPKCLSR